jgi:hypothetical protein
VSICVKCERHTYAPNSEGECMTCDPAESIDWQARAIAAERRLADLDKIIHTDGGEFARFELEQQDNSSAWWFSCHKCGELIEGTEDIGDEKNGFYFKCECGQEYIASTHLMLHALDTEGTVTDD